MHVDDWVSGMSGHDDDDHNDEHYAESLGKQRRIEAAGAHLQERELEEDDWPGNDEDDEDDYLVPILGQHLEDFSEHSRIQDEEYEELVRPQDEETDINERSAM